jgi:Na+-transporting methylmalonyl-CoA/oxaloacetate decarboxylase gamma subunit
VDNALITALIIAAVGMTLLFLFLLLFYGLLSLLTAVIKDRPSASAPPMREEEGKKVEEVVLRAAAIAIALARAEAEEASGQPMAPVPAQALTGRAGPWWALYHQRQVTTHQTTRRSR